MEHKPFDVILAGAEKQAATSLAMAYPEKRFLFLTDIPVIDGWDLPNVTIQACTKEALLERLDSLSGKVITLDSRWTEALNGKHNQSPWDGTSAAMDRFRAILPEVVLPLTPAPTTPKWILKGDLFHKPDATLIGETGKTDIPVDTHECHFRFQPYIEQATSYVFTGLASKGEVDGGGLVQVYRETVARQDWLLAGETVNEPAILDASQQLLRETNHDGSFTFNWLRNATGIHLSSFRPVPKAIFGSLREAGVDLFLSEKKIAGPGHKFVADFHYSSYERLEA